MCKGRGVGVSRRRWSTAASGTIVTRLSAERQRLQEVPTDSRSSREMTKVVKAALVYTPKASSSELERSLKSPKRTFQVRTGAYKLKVAAWKMWKQADQEQNVFVHWHARTCMRACVCVIV